MTLTRLEKCPWPYFGGKTDAAPAIWQALGDTPHYVEPFAGSLAALLLRPHPCNRAYFSETVNDIDGLLVNAWRSIQLSPSATAEAASWPVSEADIHARHLAIVKWRSEREIEHLMGDPAFHDPVIAGWWIWGAACWIGGGWASGRGPWVVGADGRITRRVKGVNRPQSREPGVSRRLPHLTGNGMGVNSANAREPGVMRKLPHLTGDGRGVNRPQSREPGVTAEHDADDLGEFHPMVMPEVLRWFAFLSARLRHVRVLNGDWQRAVTNGACKTIMVRQDIGPAGIFLDPPYRATGTRDADIYTHDDGDNLALEVRNWCAENGHDPQKRIVLAGFAGEGHEHLETLGWTAVEWFKTGYLKGGMAQQSEAGTQQKQERLWLSPHCLRPVAVVPAQASLFAGLA